VKTLDLAKSNYDRGVAKASQIPLKNRFFEQNPALNDSGASAISRPSLKKFIEVGTGPIRKLYSASGVFSNDLFTVSGTDLHRVDSTAGTSRSIGTISSDTVGDIAMAATSPIGDTVPAFLFIAEGGLLWVYTEDGQAIGHLQASGNPTAGDTVTIGTTYYKFVSSGLDTGSPAGTLANPWNVLIGATGPLSLANLFKAINDSGTPGTDYSTVLVGHTTVTATNYSGNDLYVAAVETGTTGNAIATTETSSVLAWSAATLEQGGDEMLRQIPLPDDVGAVSLAHINSYVIVIPIQTGAITGRFYYINPGETVIDPLSYATAERSPDGIQQVVVFGEMFWLCGQKTTEPWITTGNPDEPVTRFSGILFDRGTWEGTAIQVKDSLIVVDEDGAVFQIGQGSKRISIPAVEERLRRAILNQALTE